MTYIKIIICLIIENIMDLVGWLMSKQLKFHCHCNIPEYTKLLNILKFLIGQLFMHIYISHSIIMCNNSINFIQYKPF